MIVSPARVTISGATVLSELARPCPRALRLQATPARNSRMTAAARPEISHQRRLPNLECVVSLAIAEKRITNRRRVDRAQPATPKHITRLILICACFEEPISEVKENSCSGKETISTVLHP